MEKKTVELFMSSVTSFIVPCESGVIWSNQTGGVNCAHPSIEGVLLPLFGRICFPESFLNTWCDLSKYEEGAVGACLYDAQLNGDFRPLNVDELFLFVQSDICPRFGEAWLPLAIREEPMMMPDVLGPFAGQAGILTWANSD